MIPTTIFQIKTEAHIDTFTMEKLMSPKDPRISKSIHSSITGTLHIHFTKYLATPPPR